MERDKSEPNCLLELPQQALDFNFRHLWAQNASVQCFYYTITTRWSFTCVCFDKTINCSCWQMMVWAHLTGRWKKERSPLRHENNLSVWRNERLSWTCLHGGTVLIMGGMVGARGRKRGDGTERWEELTVLCLNSILLVSSFGITV